MPKVAEAALPEYVDDRDLGALNQEAQQALGSLGNLDEQRREANRDKPRDSEEQRAPSGVVVADRAEAAPGEEATGEA